MFAITGITGQVGAQVAEALLAGGKPVRAIVRSLERGAEWAGHGCEVAVVEDATDQAALARALSAVAGVFLMSPPNYDPEPGFPDTRAAAAAFARAIGQARPECVVALSSVGAQVGRFNLLNNAGILEDALRVTGVPTAFLRPAWFLENVRWDLPAARCGRIDSFLQPPHRAIDMVSVRDVGRVAAEIMLESWQGTRVVELAGPAPVSPDDLAAALAAALGHPVAVSTQARETWEPLWRAQGAKHPEARMAMLDGFNEGWLDFAREGVEFRRGSVAVAGVLQRLVGGSAP